MSKLLGPVLIVVGLFFLLLAFVSWDDVRAPGIGIGINTEPLWWQFWIPHNFDAVILPEYAIAYLVMGTAALTAGTTLMIQQVEDHHINRQINIKAS